MKQGKETETERTLEDCWDEEEQIREFNFGILGLGARRLGKKK